MGWSKTTCEQLLSLDINLLNHNQCINRGNRSQVYWQRGNGVFAALLVICQDAGTLILEYQYDGQKVSQQIYVNWYDCRFGGIRPFFSCPSCHRNKIKLYELSGNFACRTCHNLCFESQLEKPDQRGLGLAQKLTYRLGGDFSDIDLPRPKGMHRHTHERISNRIHKAKNRALKGLMKLHRDSL